jgi:hypothetical protein
MTSYKNPFEYEQATTLSPDFVNTVFIEDYNFTRFIQSTRNVFLVGERGSGKSMTLLYNSLAVRRLKAANDHDLSFVGIYIPCNTALTHKREYELFEDVGFRQVVSEHFMVLGIAHAIAEGLASLPETYGLSTNAGLAEELTYLLGTSLLSGVQPLTALMLFLDREASKSQRSLNSLKHEEFRLSAFTFSSLIQPLISSIRRAEKFKLSHFLLLIDDAHDLNPYQKQTLNSWLAYRDRSSFSFKIAVADSQTYSYKTISGGTILEGHDFLTVDLQKPFQNASSDFGKMAKGIIEKRLVTIGVQATAEEFFPGSVDFENEIARCREATKAEAQVRYPNPEDAKKRSDYVYKYGRVRYFRERASKANLPPYSGFDTIAHVSTGVIRNLLMPCYWMYDTMISGTDHASKKSITLIPSNIQSQVIIDRSEKLWEWLEHHLVSSLDNCTLDDSQHLFNLFSRLGDLFRYRLLNANTEPRAIAFSVSGMTKDHEGTLRPLLDIGRRAQLLYFRSGPAKDEGRRETYYVPNRMLWPIRGLDVVGQHARVSLKANDVWNAALGTAFPNVVPDENVQGVLFDDEQ